jgi:hypothetical protein
MLVLNVGGKDDRVVFTAGNTRVVMSVVSIDRFDLTVRFDGGPLVRVRPLEWTAVPGVEASVSVSPRRKSGSRCRLSVAADRSVHVLRGGLCRDPG